MPSLATALRPDHWLQGRDSASVPEASYHAASKQDHTDRRSNTAECRPSAQIPAHSAATTLTSREEGPPINKLLLGLATAAPPSAKGKHASATQMLPQQLLPSSGEGMSRERSSSLQGWQLSASVQQTALREDNQHPDAEASPAAASATRPAASPSPAEPVQAGAQLAVDDHHNAHGRQQLVSNVDSAVISDTEPYKSHRLVEGHSAALPSPQPSSSDEAAPKQSLAPAAIPSLQRSISLHANPKDLQTRWATPLFPTLGSMTESQAESLHSPDLDSVPSSSLTSAQRDSAQRSISLQHDASMDKASQASANESQDDVKPAQAPASAQSVSHHARRVSFAYPLPEAIQLELDASEHENPHASEPTQPDMNGPSDAAEVLSSETLGGPKQDQKSEAFEVNKNQSSQPAADEFEMLVARKDSFPRVNRNESIRGGSLEHVSSLSWRRSFLADLEDPATGEAQPLEKRSRSSSLQPANALSRLCSRSQQSDTASRPTSRAASQASLHSHNQADGPQTPPGDEDDWQSLVVQSQVQRSSQKPTQQPLEPEQDILEERHDNVRLSEQQDADFTGLPLGQSEPVQQQAVDQEEAPHAAREHHVKFASDQIDAAVQPSSMPDLPDGQDQSSTAATTKDQALLSQCLNGR